MNNYLDIANDTCYPGLIKQTSRMAASKHHSRNEGGVTTKTDNVA